MILGMTPASDSPGFARIFLRLFLPAAIQNLFFNLISIFDVLMIGQLGDASIAAVGLSGQFLFLLNVTLFGISSGSSVFGAQYWGARDRRNLHRVLGLCLGLSVAVATCFAVVALVFPAWLMSLYTPDPAVITLGVSYLRIIGWSYVAISVTAAFGNLHRSTGNTRLPMLVAVTFLCLNITLDYCLIFGRAGLPALGIRGAAAGTAISRVLECLTLLIVIYWKRMPAAAPFKALINLNLSFATHHMRHIFVVFINEFLWALGVNVINAIFARLGTQPYAAYNIAASFQTLGMFYSMACMTACGIMVGNAVGAGEEEKAFHIARRCLWIGMLGSAAAGLLLLVARNPIMSLYQVSDQTRQDATGILLIVACFLWLRGMDGIFVVGILRSGGDTRFSALLDVGAIWLAGIPAVALAAFVFHLPVEFIFMAMLMENLVKNTIGLRRYLSRRWIRNLTQQPPANEFAG